MTAIFETLRNAALAALFALLTALPAAAHESRPLFIEIAEEAGNRVTVRAVAPASVESANLPAVALGAPCQIVGAERRAQRNLEASYQCGTLSGAALTIDWPAYNPSVTTLVRATFASGETRTAILPPGEARWLFPEPQSFSGVAKSYFIIGVEHIVFGIDHLLFLAGLLFIAGTFRRAIVTATGFTIAHSLTLALVALDILRVPVPAVEAVIALSIVFLAAEIARGNRATLAWRRPALVASAFGLVHGAGFAAALAEIGLPATERTAALLFFNIGVEAGQIALILAVFGLLHAARIVSLLPPKQGKMALAFGYAIGIVAAFWFVERTMAIVAA
ncbi:MAG: HupE/UreJ family protein [Parvularculaceae bacterium]